MTGATPSGAPGAAAHRQPVLFLATAAGSGILIDSIVDPGVVWWVSLLVALAVLGWAGPKPLRTVAVVALFIPLAAARRSSQASIHESTSPWQWIHTDEAPCVVEGVIEQAPTLRKQRFAMLQGGPAEAQWQTQFELSTKRIRHRQTFQPLVGRMLVTVDARRDDLLPGDRVRVFGSLRRLEAPTNPGAVDFRDFDRRRGIHARMSVSHANQIEVIGANPLHPARPIARLGRSAREQLLGHLDESTGPLAVALVIGQRSFVSPAVRERLMETGTAHLLSVSGLHLAIIVLIAKGCATLLRLPRRWQLIWILAVTGMYVAITGGRPPVVRAAILVGMLAFAFVLHRPAQTINTLALAAVVLMFWNPENLFNVGVQLSFLAVTTLVIGAPRRGTAMERLEQDQLQRFEALIDNSRSRWRSAIRLSIRWLGQAIWYSGCVAAITTPLVWYHFHVVSPISVVTNVVVGPLMILALTAGVATVAGGWLAAPLAVVPAAICQVLLQLIEASIRVAAAVPGGHHWLPAPPSWAVILFYVGILVSLLLPTRRTSSICGTPSSHGSSATRKSSAATIGAPWRWLVRSCSARPGPAARLAWIMLWIPSAWWLATQPATLPDGTLEVTFVDVGHGTSVVIRGNAREAWLYDCGRLGNVDGNSRGIEDVLWSLGLTRLEGIFLSHADADHFNALPGILRRYSVGQIITPPNMFQHSGRSLAEARAAIDRGGIPVVEWSAGREMLIKNSPLMEHGRIEVLHPSRQWAAENGRVPENKNAGSLVLRLDWGSVPLLLPGDLESPGTEELMEQPRLPPGGILMAPHHGSLTLDATAILQWSRPREVIVSGGERAGRPEVADALAVTGAAIHVTAQTGAVRVRVDRSGRIEVRHWRENPW